MERTTLAERLGYRASERLLIVNCDDLGSSHAANAAAEQALSFGIATSATLMVPCPWAREAVARLGHRPVGVHLTLTAEYEGYRWRSLTGARSLHDAEGYMPRTPVEVWAQADLEDVARECRAQIDQALSWGIDVTHLDVHMGTLQTEPRYYAIYLDLAVRYDLPMRMAGSSAESRLGFPFRAPASRAGRIFPDHFISPWGRPSAQVFREALSRLKPGVSEIYLHPVEDGPELRGYDTVNAQTRVDDYACLMDETLRDAIEREGIKLISFAPLRDLQRRALSSRASSP